MEFEDKLILIKKALSENKYKGPDYKRLAEYGSGDLFDAGDYISKDYVPGKSGVYFTVEDLKRVSERIKDIDSLPDDDPFKYINLERDDE